MCLKYLYEKYPANKKLAKHLNTSATTISRLRNSLGLTGNRYNPSAPKFSETERKINSDVAASQSSNIKKIEYEIDSSTVNDIKNVLNMFLNQVDNTKKFNLSFKIYSTEQQNL